MNAWDKLVYNSSASLGSVAWEHISNQEGGGGEIVYLPASSISINIDTEVLIIEIEELDIYAEIGEESINAIIEEKSIEVEVNSEGAISGIQL